MERKPANNFILLSVSRVRSKFSHQNNPCLFPFPNRTRQKPNSADPHRNTASSPTPEKPKLPVRPSEPQHSRLPTGWGARTWCSSWRARAAATRRISTARGASTPLSAATAGSPWHAPVPAASSARRPSPGSSGYGSAPPLYYFLPARACGLRDGVRWRDAAAATFARAT